MLRLTARALPTVHPKAILAIIVAGMTLLGVAAWGSLTLFDYVNTLDRARDDSRQAAALLDVHAVTLLEGGANTLSRVADRMEAGGMPTLAEEALRQAVSASGWGDLSVIDPAGKTLFGPSVTVDPLERAALLGGGDVEDENGIDPLNGRAVRVAPGQVDNAPVIVLARRLHGDAGNVRGAILLSIPTASLSSALAVFGDGRRRLAGLFRPDGVWLAGMGAPGMAAAGVGASGIGGLPVLRPGEIAVEDDRLVAGVPSVVGLKRMNTLPVVVAVAVARDAVLAPWLVRLRHGMAVCVAGLAAIFGLGALGWASHRREEAVRRALRDANARLEQRVEERTADLRTLNQKLIRALTEKERANQSKARFLSAANHDLRQPFQALRLFHHLLSGRLTEPRDRALVDRMGEALDSGETLLDALLEVATLDAGVVRPELSDIPVAPILHGVVEDMRGEASAKGLSLRLHPCDAVVRTDPVLLGRMLRELLRNAVAFTEGAPRAGVLLGCRRRGGALRIEVWDTGPGIPEDQIDAIFEDFVQLGNPERDRRRGHGLGLAKVRRKAALIGAAVEVRSRPGRGSVFALTVPLAVGTESPPVPAVIPTHGDPALEGGWLILLVEDDPIQRGGMELLLQGWGNRVMVAEDGPSALQALRAAPQAPDLILTDFRLPGPLTGAQTVRRAAELAGKPIPGIILTGDTAPERLREALDAGCRLLHKPFNPDLLRAALNAAGPSASLSPNRGDRASQPTAA